MALEKNHTIIICGTAEERKVSNVLGILPSSFMILSSSYNMPHANLFGRACAEVCVLSQGLSLIYFIFASTPIINEERLSLVAGLS